MGCPSTMRVSMSVQVGVRFDAVQFACFDQRADCRPASATAVAAREQVVLAAERHRADRAFNRIGVEFDAAIIQEARQTLPSRQRITDRFGERAAAGHAGKLRFQPHVEMHCTIGFELRAPRGQPVSGRLSAHALLRWHKVR